MCDLIEEFSLVSFSTLNIQSKESVAKIVKLVDKANGCAYTLVDQKKTIVGEWRRLFFNIMNYLYT